MKSIKNNVLMRNTIYLYLLTVVKMIFPLLTLPYLARVLTKDTYGCITYVKSWMQYIQIIIDFGFILSATKNIVKCNNDKKKIGLIVGNTLIEKFLLAVISFIAIGIAIPFIDLLSVNIAFTLLYFLSVFITIFLFDFLFRGIEKMEMVAVPLIVSKTITTLFTFVLVNSDSDILNIAILEIIGNLVAVLISYTFIKKEGIFIRFSSLNIWIKDLKLSFIYFISNFATTIFGGFTTILVGIFSSSADVAVWGLCMQLVTAVKSIYSPVINSIYPQMIKVKSIKLVKKVSFIFSIPILAGCLLTLLLGDKIIIIFVGEKYCDAADLIKFFIPVLAASFYSMLYGWPVLGSIGKEKETTLTTIIASIVQIVLIFFFIVFNLFNLYTLAFACGVSEVFLFLYRYYIYSKNKNKFVK